MTKKTYSFNVRKTVLNSSNLYFCRNQFEVFFESWPIMQYNISYKQNSVLPMKSSVPQQFLKPRKQPLLVVPIINNPKYLKRSCVKYRFLKMQKLTKDTCMTELFISTIGDLNSLPLLNDGFITRFSRKPCRATVENYLPNSKEICRIS